MRFSARSRTLAFLLASLAFIACSALPPAARAQSAFDGKYRCVRVEVSQKTAKCQSPPLVLHRDGSYQIWGEQGTYEVVQGRWLVLSHSKRRGLGHFVSTGEIVFEYEIDGKRCRVTFRQLFDPPPGFIWG
jgi:hypothetical protein